MPKIMLVEDDNNLREIYEARLLAEGYEIVSAEDGEQALALAVKEKPDLIISDVMMPKISGFDMLDILRSTPETKHTKVIMMTALSQAEDKTRADKLGADRYLVKSQVTLEDVAQVAKEVLGGDDAASPSPTSAAPASDPAATAPATPASDDATAQAPAEPANDGAAATPVTPVADPAPAAQDDQTQATANPPVADEPATSNDPAAVAQPTAKEEDAVEAKIEEFVNNLPVEPPAEVAVTEPPTDQPATDTTPTQAQPPETPDTSSTNTEELSVDATNAAAENAAKMAEAANELLQNSTEQAAPSEKAATGGGLPGKKVIQPLHDPASSTPDLNALLAKEEANNAVPTPGATTVISPAEQTPAETPAAPEAPAAAPEEAPPAKNSDGVDPNSIAL